MHRIILSALFLIAGMARALACGPFDRLYTQDEHVTFRIFAFPYAVEHGSLNGMNKKFRSENLRLWQGLTSKDIPLTDIEAVVYSWDMSLTAQLAAHAKGERTGTKEPETLRKNAFARWIIERKDAELAQYLVLAKESERVMESQNSLWYYHVDGDRQSTRLAEMARMDAANYSGRRLADRYALLRIRSLFASKHYAECVAVWEKQKKVFRAGALRDKAEGYAAGAYARTGRKDQAKSIYTRLHDYESLLLLSDEKTKMGRLTLCATLWPKDDYTLALLQQRINDVEKGEEASRGGDDRAGEYARLLSIVKTVVRKKGRRSAEWNYAAAFLEDKLGHEEAALRYLRKARRCKAGAEVKDALRVLADYTRVKYAKAYDAELEGWLLGELIWMSGKAKENLTPPVRKTLAEKALWDVKAGISVFYWDDMIRKIVLGQVVPLCIRSHYKVRALQYANMGENHFFNIVGKVNGVDLADYRALRLPADSAGYNYNALDYENDYFLNLDSLGVESVERLIYRMQHPESLTDRFLSEYGYTDMQYLYDIAGTQMIASMRYREAVEYLKKVPAAFQASRNYEWEWYTRDPFDPKRKKLQRHDVLYKLHFAEAMVSLERKMREEKDPNARAEAMLRYVAGLENSVTRCWPLTSYYKGYWECYPMFSRAYTRRIDHIVRQSTSMKRRAIELFTDKERAARACCDFSLFETAARLYPETRSGSLVRGKCDVLKDYTALRGVNYRR